MQFRILLLAFAAVILLYVFGLLLGDADAVAVVPLLAAIAAAKETPRLDIHSGMEKRGRSDLHHEPGTVRCTAYTIGLVILLEYCCYFRFAFRQVEFAGDFFFL